MDARMMELVHRAFDGECTADERHELEVALSHDPELLNFQTQLRQLDEQLRSMPEEVSPEGLRPAILDAIRNVSPSGLRHARRGSIPSRRRDLAIFLAGAAAMFVIGVGLLRLPLPGLDGEDTVGTLLPTEPTPNSQPVLLSGETLGELRWADTDGGTLIELLWSADAPALLELEIDPEAPKLLRVRSEGREASIPLVGGAKSGQ
jgi:anti-sigma factor RsiW